jgi:hypothetical protein
LLLGSSVAAWAQPRPPVQVGLGDKRFQAMLAQGKDALANKDLAMALKVFEDAYRYSPKPVALFYLGKVASEQQRIPAALDLYRRYLEAMQEDAEPELRADAQQLLNAPRDVGCEVAVQGEVGGLLSVDGRLAGALPLATPLLLTAGSHQLLLEKGRRRVETQVTLAARRQAEVRFTLVPPLALLTLTPGVLLITQPAGLDPTLALAVRRSVSEAVGQQNAVLVTPETQADTLARKPELLGCLEQLRCQEQVAQQTAAQFVLHLTVTTPVATTPAVATPDTAAKPAGAFQFAAELLDVDVGVVSVRATQSCNDCNLKRGMQMLGDMMQEMLRSAASRPRGTIKISSEPPGAQVEVDGRVLGETPYLRDAFVGPHEVVLSRPEFVHHRANINVEDGLTAELAVPLAAEQKPQRSGTPPIRIAKWTLFGIGVAAVIGGITLLALNGTTSCNSAVPQVCGDPFDGRPGGIPLVAVGSLALGTSAYLFLRDARQNPTPQSPANQPATASLNAIVHF